MTSTPFNWSTLIAEIADISNGISPDVTFQLEEGSELEEVKAHKMILSIASPVFRKMFFTSDVGDKTAKEVKIKETTMAAFQIMIDAIYGTKSIEDSLKGKSVDEIFIVVNLVERYQMPELRGAIRKYLSSCPVQDSFAGKTVWDTASEAMQYTSLFKEEARILLVNCAYSLIPDVKNTATVCNYFSENEDKKEVIGTLLAILNDIPCSNCGCKKYECKNTEEVKKENLRAGLTVVTNNNKKKDGNIYWGNCVWGVGKVTKVDVDFVYVKSVKSDAKGLENMPRADFGGTRYKKIQQNKYDENVHTNLFCYCCDANI